MPSARTVFIENFQAALTELMLCYVESCECEVSALGDCADHNVVAVVGLCDDSFRASIALTAESDLVISQFNATPEGVADCMGELCNQLTGRLKNKLSIFGLQPNMSTPTTIRGSLLSVSWLAGNACSYRVRVSGGLCVAQMSLVLDESLELTENLELASMAEGSLSFF